MIKNYNYFIIGEPCDAVYVVLTGQLVGLDELSNIASRINSLECAGADSFRSGSPYKATYITAKVTTVCSMKRKDYDQIADTLAVYFRKLSILKGITKPDEIYPFCKIMKYVKNSLIVKAGEPMGSFYIVIEGSVKRQYDQTLVMEQRYFGEDGNDGIEKVWPSNMIANEPVKILTISSDGFNHPEFASVRKYLSFQPLIMFKRSSSNGSLNGSNHSGTKKSPSSNSIDSTSTSQSQRRVSKGSSGGSTRRKSGASNRRRSNNSANGYLEAMSDSESVGESTRSADETSNISSPKRRKKKKGPASGDDAVLDAQSGISMASGAASPSALVLAPIQWMSESLDSFSCGLAVTPTLSQTSTAV